MGREKSGNVLTTLVFTDIVGSTQVAEEMGNRRWRELLARHHRIVRTGLRSYGGREVDTAGDGLFARFDSPASAINFAASAADALRELGIEIRAGIHIGECEIFDGKLSGINVHAAARTMGQAGAGEILVTGSVRDLVRGGGFGFADRGVHELRGIEGEWRLFELTSIENSHRTPPLPEGEARARRGQIESPRLVKRRRVRLAAAAASAAVVAAAGVFALVQAVGGASATPLTGCEITSYPPLNDRSFNQAVYDGLTDASNTWAVSVIAKVTTTRRQWFRTIDGLIHQGCGLVVTLLGDAAQDTIAEAKANPHTRFVSIDAPDVRGTSNLLSLQFRPDQGAFLAGYLAAGVTKTGEVGTFGGLQIDTVTPFMDGFWAGVQHYNQVHGTDVRVLGWKPQTQRGLFVSQDPTNFSAFIDAPGAHDAASNLIRSGADVIFPADGPIGEESSCRAALRARGVLLIGVDTDQHYATPECEARWVTSVMKVYRRMVYLAMGEVVHDRFAGGMLRGTLKNGGVALAPYYGLESRIPRGLQDELERVKQDVIGRSVSTAPRSYFSG